MATLLSNIFTNFPGWTKRKLYLVFFMYRYSKSESWWPVAYAGISKGGGGPRKKKLGDPGSEASGRRKLWGLELKLPAAGGYGGLKVKPSAAEENLQFWGQNIAVFEFFLIDFWLFYSKVSDELNGINGLPVTLCSIVCVNKIVCLKLY